MIYGVYLAYNKWDVLPDEECRNPDIPNYPQKLLGLEFIEVN